MTNQEWLSTLKPNDFAFFCLHYLPMIGRSWTVSRYGVSTWLEQEYVGNQDGFIREFNDIIEAEESIEQCWKQFDNHKDKGESLS